VPIVGTSLQAAAVSFREHLNGVLHLTITDTPLVVFTVGKNPTKADIAFRHDGRPQETPLQTKYGLLWLYLGQVCTSTLDDAGQHVLHTVKYTYTLRRDDEENPLLRWEYDKQPGNRYCRHHLQGPIAVPIKRHQHVSLNDLHVPTGFVTVEEVLRFCIVDLKVPSRAPSERPMAPREPGDHNLHARKTWDEILTESYERFKSDFAPRGQL